MKFSMLEQAREIKANYKKTCAENDKKRESAKQEVQEAKEKVQELINCQIESGEDSIDEIAKAQARVLVSEAKYQRLIQEIGEKNPEMNTKGIDFSSVNGQFFNYAHSEEFQKDMKEELEAMQAAKDQYMAAYEKTLVKFYALRQELRENVMEAERFFDKPATGKLPLSFDEWLLRPYGLWWQPNDAENALTPIKTRANEAVEGKIPEFKEIVLPEIVPEHRDPSSFYYGGYKPVEK